MISFGSIFLLFSYERSKRHGNSCYADYHYMHPSSLRASSSSEGYRENFGGLKNVVIRTEMEQVNFDSTVQYY